MHDCLMPQLEDYHLKKLELRCRCTLGPEGGASYKFQTSQGYAVNLFVKSLLPYKLTFYFGWYALTTMSSLKLEAVVKNRSCSMTSRSGLAETAQPPWSSRDIYSVVRDYTRRTLWATKMEKRQEQLLITSVEGKLRNLMSKQHKII